MDISSTDRNPEPGDNPLHSIEDLKNNCVLSHVVVHVVVVVESNLLFIQDPLLNLILLQCRLNT